MGEIAVEITSIEITLLFEWGQLGCYAHDTSRNVGNRGLRLC
jgi:hypothetical protein